MDDQQVNLTAKEFQILHKLMQNPQHVVTREQLEESLYAWGDEIESNAIEVFIYQLRKKIGSSRIKTDTRFTAIVCSKITNSVCSQHV